MLFFECYFNSRSYYLPEPLNMITTDDDSPNDSMETLDTPINDGQSDPSEPICINPSLFEHNFKAATQQNVAL
jgi:hypothetical protein